MTARPMTGEERERILRWAQMFVADCEDRGVPPLHTSGDATFDLARALLSTSSEARRLREALEKIARWHGEFPPTGQFWDKNQTQPMSYSTCFGSNGERDFMREIARAALSVEGEDELA